MTLFFILLIMLAAALAVLLVPVWKAPELPQKKLFIAVTCGVFLACGFGLYYTVGSPDIVPLLSLRESKIAELKETIVARSADVKANPRNLTAWVELGESFMQTGQFTGAANAFRHAVVLSNGNPLLIMAYAGALISEADGKVTDDAKKSLEMVLIQQPDNPEARYFMAVRELQDGHTQEAMKAMKELYHSLPDNSPLKAMIDQQIGRK